MREQHVGLIADAVDDDVYQWDLWLGTFTPDCPLAEVPPLPPLTLFNSHAATAQIE